MRGRYLFRLTMSLFTPKESNLGPSLSKSDDRTSTVWGRMVSRILQLGKSRSCPRNASDTADYQSRLRPGYRGRLRTCMMTLSESADFTSLSTRQWGTLESNQSPCVYQTHAPTDVLLPCGETENRTLETALQVRRFTTITISPWSRRESDPNHVFIRVRY